MAVNVSFPVAYLFLSIFEISSWKGGLFLCEMVMIGFGSPE